MENEPDLNAFTHEILGTQSDTRHNFRVNGYAGSVEVAEWNPMVSASGKIYDAETVHNLPDWLLAAAEARGVELSTDDLWELVQKIEETVRNPRE